MFDADRPIQHSGQDRLNRSLFAKYLARCMLDHQDPSSLVVGLYGGWGVGKTSIINLTIEELQFAASNQLDTEKPIILNFSPWSYSGQNELIYSFFRRLSSALRSVDYLENADQIIYLLELYVSFFTRKPVPRALRTKRSLWQRLTPTGREDVYAWESGKDLTLVKAELNELLRAQRHKIIIIIDNISRLYPQEIKQIFQIVKSMGDYANTIYLLSLDKDQAIKSLNSIESNGEALIEKVVQLPFNIPPILAQDLENILAEHLNDIVATVPLDTWNAEYWADVYYSSLKYFFHNCRDITRYINTLAFSYSRLRDIVNPVDFFSLTAIEVFLPAVYAGIRDNKDLFTGLLDHVYKLDEAQLRTEKARCDEVLARNDRVSREVLLALMLKLFPRLRRIYQPQIEFYHSDALARKLRRVCNADMFDAYFRLSMQSGQLLASEFETLLALANDNERFDQALLRLNQDGRVIKFLDMVDDKILSAIPINDIPVIVNSLIDNGDLFPSGIPGKLSLDTPVKIHRIIHRLLQRIKSRDDRFVILQTAIAQAKNSLYIIIHELNEQGREHVEESDTFLPLEFRDLSPDQLVSLRKLAVSRIQSWTKHDRLIEHPKLLPILYAWMDWGNADECRHYVRELVNKDRGLVVFLTAIFANAIDEAMTQYVINPAWGHYLDDISMFIAIKQIQERAKAIFEDPYFEKLREREQLALMIFLDLINISTTKVIPNTTV